MLRQNSPLNILKKFCWIVPLAESRFLLFFAKLNKFLFLFKVFCVAFYVGIALAIAIAINVANVMVVIAEGVIAAGVIAAGVIVAVVIVECLVFFQLLSPESH